ncbi:MAG: DUF2752 domain-containing protein [Acutalibacteraceae bacterium]
MKKTGIIAKADAYLLRRPVLYRIIVIAAPFVAALALWLCAPLLISFGKALPSCPVNTLTGLYCPGCGITRSIVALYDGDILLSLRSNITPYVAAVLIIMLYIEWVAHAFGKRVRTFIHSGKIMAIIGAALLIWLTVRNFFPSLCPVAVDW